MMQIGMHFRIPVVSQSCSLFMVTDSDRPANGF